MFTTLEFLFDRVDLIMIVYQLPPFCCLDLLASIVSMSRHSMLECVRFRSITLDIEAFGNLFVEVF